MILPLANTNTLTIDSPGSEIRDETVYRGVRLFYREGLQSGQFPGCGVGDN